MAGKEMEIKKMNNLVTEVKKELDEEKLSFVKNKVKKLIKNIRRTEILLDQQKKELKEILDGKREFTENELLFDEE